MTPPGERVFHIHAVGRCDGADGFQSAGGHYNPENRQHGFRVQGYAFFHQRCA